jgi:uncharacterized membrane protein YedE/YeeE
MMIHMDWVAFSPWQALMGGGLIGLATTLLLLGVGRIAGVSGIVGGLLMPQGWRHAWRWWFVVGLMAALPLYRLVADVPAIEVSDQPALLITAGLLVGVGTRYAAGCTSGHGICGLSRGSVRSVVATVTFMLVGFVTVWISRHAWQGG